MSRNKQRQPSGYKTAKNIMAKLQNGEYTKRRKQNGEYNKTANIQNGESYKTANITKRRILKKIANLKKEEYT